jgi:hypothetical protein
MPEIDLDEDVVPDSEEERLHVHSPDEEKLGGTGKCLRRPSVQSNQTIALVKTETESDERVRLTDRERLAALERRLDAIEARIQSQTESTRIDVKPPVTQSKVRDLRSSDSESESDVCITLLYVRLRRPYCKCVGILL